MKQKTWRIIGIGFFLTAFLLSLKLIFAAMLLLILAVIGLSELAERYSGVRKLFEPRGPRTDVRYMTKAELFRSGRSFLVGGAALAIVLMALMKLTSLLANPRSEQPFLMGVFFLLVIFECVLLFAGAYLLFRGLFRRRSYDPHLVFLMDSLKDADRD